MHHTGRLFIQRIYPGGGHTRPNCDFSGASRRFFLHRISRARVFSLDFCLAYIQLYPHTSTSANISDKPERQQVVRVCRERSFNTCFRIMSPISQALFMEAVVGVECISHIFFSLI